MNHFIGYKHRKGSGDHRYCIPNCYDLLLYPCYFKV